MSNAVIVVRNSSELKAAVERLAAGEGGTVLMEPGRYWLSLIDPNRSQTDAPVRILSADSDNPAVLTQLTLRNRENLTVENVVFDSAGTERSASHRDIEMTGSKGIAILNSVFRGDATEALDGTPGQIKGVTAAVIRASDGVTLHGNHFSGYYHNVTFMDAKNIAFTGNEVTRGQGDGIRIAGVQDLLIQGNHLHGMLGSTQDINHSDMIQFWGTNISQNTERVTIRDNIINTADGPAYQMIFGRNEHVSTNGWLFQDIVIEGNLLYGAHHNTISIAETQNMVVRHNTVIWNRDTHALLEGGAQGISVNGWVRAPGSTTHVIENNIATNINGATGPNGLVTYGDRSQSSHHSHHFVNLDAGGTADLRDLSLRPDSPWNGVMGAPMTWATQPVEGLTATAMVGRFLGDRSRVVLDASLSRDGTGYLGEDATFTWIFADGTRKTGRVVEHDFRLPGQHGYVLEVRAADGRVDRIERTLRVEDPDLLFIEARGGVLRDGSAYGAQVSAKDGVFEEDGFRLDGTSRIDISRAAKHLYSLDSFGLSLTFTPEAGTSGTIVELFRAMEARIEADGRFTFTITTTKGTFHVRTEAGAVQGTEAHRLGIILDGAAGELRLIVDGEVAASAPVSGYTKPVESWGLVIGNIYGGASVKGVVSDIRLRAEPALDPEPRDVPAPAPADEPPLPTGPAFDEAALLARFDFEGDMADRSLLGTRALWDETKLRFGEGSDGTGRSVALGDRIDGVVLARWNAHLFELDAFHIVFDVQRTDLKAGGRLLSLYQTLDLSVSAKGVLTAELVTDEDQAVVSSVLPVLADTAWHSVELAYDGAYGLMQLVVDDAVVGSVAITGTTAPALHWGLALGRLWGGAAKGFIDDLRLYGEAYLRDPPPPAEEAPGLVSASASAPGQAGGAEAPAGPPLLAAFDFEGDLSEAGGRRVGVLAKGDVRFVEGREGGQAVRIGDDASLQITRDNAFLHERDAFAFAFDLKKDAAKGDGRVLHFNKAMEAKVQGDEFVFSLRTDKGAFQVSTRGAALGDDAWHRVEVGYDDAVGRLSLSVDGQMVQTKASGTTAPGLHWGLTMGAAWGDALEGAIDDFRMWAAPDWSLG